MARGKTDLLSKLADRGEEAISKVGDVPGAQRLLDAAGGMRDRLDDIQKRLRGLDAIEKRLTALERKVDKMSAGTKTTRRAPSRKTTSRAKSASRTRTGSRAHPAAGQSSEQS